MFADIGEGIKTALNPIRLRLDSENLEFLANNLAKKTLRKNDVPLFKDEETYKYPKTQYKLIPSQQIKNGQLILSTDFLFEGTPVDQDAIRQKLQLDLSTSGYSVLYDWGSSDHYSRNTTVILSNEQKDLTFNVEVNEYSQTVGSVIRNAQEMKYKANGDEEKLSKIENVLEATDELKRKHRQSQWVHENGKVMITAKDAKGNIKQQAIFDREGELSLKVYETRQLSAQEIAGLRLESGQWVRNTINPEYLAQNPTFQRDFLNISSSLFTARQATANEITQFLNSLLNAQVDKEKTAQMFNKQKQEFSFLGTYHGMGQIDWVKNF